MKNWKRAISLLLCAVMLLGNFPVLSIHAHAADTSGTCGENLTWTLDADGKLTISGTGAMYDYDTEPFWDYRDQIKIIVIEEGVTTLCHEAFSSSAVTSVSLPSTLESIGMYAFSYCKALTKIDLPEGLKTIGGSAFHGCDSLETLTIPSTVTELGSPLAESSEKLTVITFTGNMPTLGVNTFRTGSGSLTVYYPGTDTTWDTDKMKNYGYAGTIQWVPVYATVVEGTCGADLTWVLDEVGTLTISGTGRMSDIYEPMWYDWREDIKKVRFSPEVTYIGNNSFKDCVNLTDVELPAALIGIGDYAFYGCSSLEAIEIPDLVGVMVIGESAFEGCVSLKEIVIPFRVTDIEYKAFADCSSLETIVISNTVKYVAYNAFKNCGSLTDIYYVGTKEAWESNSVNLDSELTKVHYDVTDFAEHWVEGTKEATCGEAGYTGETCACGYERNRTDIPATGSHTFDKEVADEKYLVSAATCQSAAIYHVSCSVCGAEGEETFESGEIGDHSMDSNNTCTVCGYTGGTCGNNVTWVLENGTLTISGTGIMESYWSDLNVPWYSQRKTITGVVIEEGVTTISVRAFVGCSSLTSVKIPGSVTKIGSSAFKSCTNLEDIQIPAGVTEIGSYAFQNCENLKNIQMPAGITVIGTNAFYGCDNLTEVYYGGTAEQWAALGEDVPVATYIHYNCETSENHWAADHLDPTCTEAGYDRETCACGYERNRTDIPAAGHSMDSNNTCTVCGYVGGKCGDNLTWVLENGVLTISGTGAMDHMQRGTPWAAYLEDICVVDIKPGITRIGAFAFSDCSNLTAIDIPAGVTNIGNNAFSGCSSLTAIDIPDGVTAIEISTFLGCSSLTSIDIPAGVTIIGNSAFSVCSSLISVNIPDSVTSIGERAFQYCSSLVSIKIPASVSAIKDDTFHNCESLTDVTIPVGVATIGGYAFQGCTGLKSLNLPSGLETVGSNAFRACTGLTSVNLPDSLTTIGISAFNGCSGLTSVRIPNGMTIIEDYAFAYCRNLISVEIPAGITTVDTYAFNGCEKISDVYFGGTAEQWSGLGAYAPKATYIHCNVTNPAGHWFGDHLDPTCTEAGYDREACACGYERNKVNIPATGGHVYDQEIVDEKYLVSAATCTDAAKYYLSCECGEKGTETFEYGEIDIYHHKLDADGKCICCNQSSFVCGENVTWSLSNGVLTFSGSGLMEFVISDDCVTPWYDYREKITSVVIEDGITNIYCYAFTGCTNLKNIVIGNDVSGIWEWAFEFCSSLTSVVIPANVKTISFGTFDSCSSLRNIYFQGNAPEFFMGGSFDTVTATAYYPRTASGWTEEVMREAGGNITWVPYCLEDRHIFNQTIVDKKYLVSAATCTESAVYYCSCECGEKGTETFEYGEPLDHDMGEWGVILDPTCTEEGTKQRNCSRCDHFETEPIPAVGHSYDANHNCTVCGQTGGYCGDPNVNDGKNVCWTYDEATGKLTIFGTGTMEEYSYRTEAPWLALKPEHVVVAEGVSAIGSSAFRDCVNMTDIDLPDSLTKIGTYAFQNCWALTTIALPDNLLVIESGVFGSSGITSIAIPSGVEVIDQGVFEYCESLQTVTFSGSVREIRQYAFFACSKLENLVLPEGLEVIGYEAFYACQKLTAVSIPNSVKEIHRFAFEGCAGLTSVEISENVTDIGEVPFLGCDNLTGIWVAEGNANYSSDSAGVLFDKNKTTLIQAPAAMTGTYTVPSSVTTIAECAFCSCAELKSITLPAGLKTIGALAFSGCSRLNDMIIPDGVISIGDYAFADCSNLESITVPESVTAIGGLVFHYCSKLKDVYYKGTESGWTALGAYVQNTAYIHYNCVSADKHWMTKTVDATCTEAGWTCETCSCGYEKNVTETEAALGHDMGQWETVKEATPYEDGQKRRDCSRCDHFETEVIPASGAKLAITGQPKSVTANVSTTVTMKVVATGEGLTYQWQWRKDTSSAWAITSVSGNKTASISIPVTASRNGYQYRCKITDAYGVVAYSGAATLTVRTGPSITTQPKDVTANEGTTATFKVVASGSGLTYQWQWRANSSSTWAATTVSGNKTATIKVPATVARNGYQYRCKITDAYGVVAYSGAAILAVRTGPSITTQPKDVTANVGATATFKVVAAGEGLTYQWQWRANASSAWAATTVSGNKTATISVPATAARNGYQYRCVVTDVNGSKVYSDAATLTVKAGPAITSQPTGVTANVGATATFKIVATGEGLTYQWQWRKNASSTWATTTVSGNKTATISVPATAARNGYQYRCVVTDVNGSKVHSNAATLTVKSGPSITTQPKDTYVKTGVNAKLTVAATGEGLTYQWQYRTSSGGTWNATTLTGAKTATLTIPGAVSRNGYQYRCVITDANGNKVTSNAATLTVFGIKTQPKSVTANVGETVTFKVAATGTGLTYQWQWRKNSSSTWASTTVSGNKTATITVPATAARNGYQYRCKITDTNGNVIYSSTATLTVN